MTDVFLARMVAYSFLPILLAVGHLLLDRQARRPARAIELFMIYLFAISVGANGWGGAFGHLFLSDLIADSIGWAAGSPFQLEMGFANLALGVLGFVSVSRRDGFRAATITATIVIGVGATIVHLLDIVHEGNLSPGNTIQNVGNLLDPILFIVLLWLSARRADPDAASADFLRWQMRQQPVAYWSAAGIGTGFGVGFAVGGVLWGTLIGAAIGVGIGVALRQQIR